MHFEKSPAKNHLTILVIVVFSHFSVNLRMRPSPTFKEFYFRFCKKCLKSTDKDFSLSSLKHSLFLLYNDYSEFYWKLEEWQRWEGHYLTSSTLNHYLGHVNHIAKCFDILSLPTTNSFCQYLQLKFFPLPYFLTLCLTNIGKNISINSTNLEGLRVEIPLEIPLQLYLLLCL